MKLTTQPQRAVEVRPVEGNRFSVFVLIESRTGEIGYDTRGNFDAFGDAWTEAQRLAALYGIRAHFLSAKAMRTQYSLDTYFKLCIEL